MSKTLDFNSVQRPTLILTMMDEAKTQIHVSSPTEKLVEELQTISAELDEILREGDKDSINATYNLAARLISCNRDCVTVTAEELREKYKLKLEDLVIFFSVYIDFIDEISEAKN